MRLIDVLEHVRSEEGALGSTSRAIRHGGFLILSVPTAAYIDYFGEAFDNAVGHLRHYEIGELLQKLESHGFRVLDWTYHTSGLQAQLCRLWYKQMAFSEPFNSHLRILLFPLIRAIDHLGRLTQFKRAGPRPAGIALLAQKS